MRFFRRRAQPSSDDARAVAQRSIALLDEVGRLDERFSSSGDPADLKRAAEVWGEITDLLPDHRRAGALNEAGARYLKHHEYTEDRESLDIGRQLLVEAVGLAAPDALGMILGNLGGAWRSTYEVTDDPADLHRALDINEQACTATPADAPHRPAVMSNLASALRESYKRDGDLAALDRAIELDERAVTLAPPGSVHRLTHLNGLANGLSLRLSRRNRVEDADRLVRCREEALALAQPGTRIQTKYLGNLANAFGERAEVTGEVDDLDRAVRTAEEALAATSQDSPTYAMTLFTMQGHLAARYEVLGSVADLERAIVLAERALAMADQGSRRWLLLANDVAGLLRSRFDRLGTFDDLERCIALLQESVALTDASSPEAATRAGNLGNALRARYLRGRRPADLRAAIETYERAFELAVDGSPVELNILQNLGTALNDRYDLTGDGADLEQSKNIFATAYERSVPRSAGWRSARNNQGRITLAQARWAGSVELAREAVSILAEAAAAAIEGTPDSLICRTNLGSAQELTGRLDGDEEMIRAALGTFRAVAVESCEVAPELGLDAARLWGVTAGDKEWWADAADAFRMGRECLDQLFQRQGRRDQKESWLEVAAGMAPRAAYALARAGDLRAAVVTAETGRALLMTETVERTSTDDLDALARDGHGELAAAYESAVDALAAVDRAPSAVPGRMGVPPAHRPVVELRQEVDKIAERIRTLPGQESFRRPPTLADVEAAANDCPVVYLAPAKAGAVALVVSTTGSVEAIELPRLAVDELGEQIERYVAAYETQHGDYRLWASTLLDVTGWLWPAVMEPVVHALAGESRAVLIPMGWLGILPLHAAWRDDPTDPTRRRYALDDLLLTYAPNARSLLRARRVAPVSATDGVLVVADPAPVRAPALPHAQQEGSAVRASFASGVLLAGRAAGKAIVLTEMERWPVLHFACHADSDMAEPLDSCLLLANDEKIRLGELIAADAFTPRVVVMSACETALIGTDIPDEVVSLPIGFLQMGARSVVGSFWPVHDESTAALMQRFYQIWRDPSDGSDVDPASALRAAQQWLRDGGGGQDAGRGRDLNAGTASADRFQDDRDHPVHWAAFCYFGA